MDNARFAEGVMERKGRKPKPPSSDTQAFHTQVEDDEREVYYHNDNYNRGKRFRPQKNTHNHTPQGSWRHQGGHPAPTCWTCGDIGHISNKCSRNRRRGQIHTQGPTAPEYWHFTQQ